MQSQRSKASYRAHRYSGSKRGRKASRAQLKRFHGDTNTTHKDLWRKKTKPNEPIENEPLPSTSGKMSQPRTKPGQELDKLKRRLIRSVARLIKEKKTEEEVWNELKKECGKNCKTLWARMKSITMKKLKRLIEAEDCMDSVPSIARMTLTDWLLYDLVLVHEKIDVIDRNNTNDSAVLKNLFSLVQKFKIEGLSGDELADAWTAATVRYNSEGRQCSPMLMQRRWYQIKELTRMKLYQFWFTYRGNKGLLEAARQDPPTELQRAIALRYPGLITKQFPTWEESVQKKLVILPDEFEMKMSKNDIMKPRVEMEMEETAPDVLIVEQKIDTITLDSDSDYDEANDENSILDPEPENNEVTQTPIIVQVKTEPEDIDITEHHLYPEKPDKFQDAIDSLEIEETKITMGDVISHAISSHIENIMMPRITNVTGAAEGIMDVQGTSKNNVYSEKPAADVLKPTVQKLIAKHITSEFKSLDTVNNYSQQSIVIDDDDDDVIPVKDLAQFGNIVSSDGPNPSKDQIRNSVVMKSIPHNTYNLKTDTVTEHTNLNETLNPIITAVASGSKVEAKMENMQRNEGINNVAIEIPDHDEIMEIITKATSKTQSNIDLGHDNFEDDGIEFVDDGIEYNEDHNEQSDSNETSEVPTHEDSVHEGSPSPKFDLKLLMNPVIYTTKLDDMAVYKGKSLFSRIDGKQLIDEINLESKPVSAKSITVDQLKTDNQDIENANNAVQESVEDSQEFEDDLYKNESSTESDSDAITLDDSKKVKLSSSLLQKPRSRSYNPIQLCKNPDFNTRLKRLNVGFFSSERNRVFLKACKPMTIDLSKAFESKLIYGTMYLKPSDTVVDKEIEDVSETAASVMPSAVAVQSLMDNTTDVDKILRAELQKRVIERNKTITLPNISLVRHINGQLLMAEVAPLVSNAEKFGREVSGVLNQTSIGNANTLDSFKQVVTNNKAINSINQLPTAIPNLTPIISAKQTAPVLQQSNNTHDANKDKSKENVIYNNPLLPMLNSDKSNDCRTLDQQRKKQARPNNVPLWFSKKTVNETTRYSDSLLTIDTLYRVLNTFDPTVNYKPKIKANNSKIVQPRAAKIVESSEVVDNIKQTDPPPLVPRIMKPSTPTLLTKPSPNTSDLAVKAKPTRAKKQTTCCWARTRINKLNGAPNVRQTKHKCPALCKCCCKEILRQTEINNEIKLLEQLQGVDAFDQTIEEVIQQSRDSSNAQPCVKPFAEKQPRKQHSKRKLVTTPILPSEFSVSFDEPAMNSEPNIETSIPALEETTEMTIDLDDDHHESSPEPQAPPTPKIRVYSGNSVNNQLTKAGTTPPPPPLAPITAIAGTTRGKPNIINSSHVASITTSKEPESSQPPCSCLPGVDIDKQDGLNPCPQHSKTRGTKETKIYLNKKSMTASTPFYVGPKKILLTNVSLPVTKPRPVTPPPPSPPKVLHPAIASAAGPPPQSSLLHYDLPEGVQIVMLPDGSLTYLVDPGVELTLDEVKILPKILHGVKVNIRAAGIVLPKTNPIKENNQSNSNDNLKNVAATKPEPKQISSKKIDSADNSKDSTNSSAEVDLSKESDQAHLKEKETESKQAEDIIDISENEDDGKDPLCVDENDVTTIDANTDSLDCVKPDEKVDDSSSAVENGNTLNKADDENEKNTAVSSSRNLLSDLMEMSGILEEDVAPNKADPPSNTVPVAPIIDTNAPSVSNVERPTVTAVINEKLCNLNTVTNFAELKYACDNQGLFFKLDIVTGDLVPINVCIQKTAETKGLKNTMPSDVIDLTDDPNVGIDDSVDETEASPNPGLVSKINYKQVINDSLIKLKPRTLKRENVQQVLRSNNLNSMLINNQLLAQQVEASSRLIEVPVTPKTDMEEKKKALMKRLSNNLKPLKILQNKHKVINILKKTQLPTSKTPIVRRISNLNRIDTKIDLVDSDAPMEEEYLLEESSDDSDDEPLAKVAKKIKENVLNDNDKESYIQEEITQEADTIDDDEDMDFEEDIGSRVVEPPVVLNPMAPGEPVPTQLVLSGAAVQNTLPNILHNLVPPVENEDSQDDCILGF